MSASPTEMRAHAERVASSARRVVAVDRLEMKYPVLFGCPSCEKLFPTRRSCNAHIESHDAMAAQLSKPERAKLLFHPQASERELKACLFANLPWQDKALLSPLIGPADMDLCYVTKTLVLREREDDYSR